MAQKTTREKFYRWEKILKGASSHRRLEILFLIDKYPDISTEGIVETLNINYQTGAHHAQKIVKAGLASTHREGASLLHKITPYGKSIINLLINL